ncbi:hypothetical protein KY306_01315 [Candidatus Woesearchaeota archaeon]|nr:hypothetical protein [Candidatus Woesearchaeota archaeon]
MNKKLSEAEKKAKREFKLLISCFIALKHIHQLIEKAEGDVGKVSEKQARSEIKHIWRKLRTGIFGSAERAERKIARDYKELLGDIKEAETDLSPKEVEKINFIITRSGVFNSFLEKDTSRGGAVEKALRKAMAATGEERLKILKADDEEILKDIKAIEGFEIEMKEIISEIEEVETTKKRVEKDLKSALETMKGSLLEIIKAFKPVFSTTNVADRKRMIVSIKANLKLKGISILGVGGNAIVLKINLLGKDYALKISTEKLTNEIVNLIKAKGIMGIPKFYFETSLEGLHTILVEYVAGPTLSDYVKEHSLPNDFFERIEKIVKKLHARGMAHRDIQDANVMVVGGYPYFLDFSLASPKATPAQQRFDLIFIEALKLQYMMYTSRYSNRQEYLAAAKKILGDLSERFRTETDRENKQTIQIILNEARKRGLPI